MDDEDVALLIAAIEEFVYAKVVDERRLLYDYVMRRLPDSAPALDRARENLANVLSALGTSDLVEPDEDDAEDDANEK